MSLGEKIKKLRKKKGLSQGELAIELGINPTHLSRLETGKYQPSIEVLKKLALGLDVTADYLLGGDDGDPTEIHIEDKTLAERIRLIDALEEEDRRTLLHMIETMLMKQRMRSVLQGGAGA